MSGIRMLEGKVAVVTGAGGGIGREVAIALAAAGAKVIVNDIGVSLNGEGGSAQPAQETKTLIEQRGGRAEINTDSVASWESASKIIQSALDHFGRIDVLVNNAGILRDALFHKMSPEDWRAVVDVHLNGSFYTSRAAADHFRQQESGAYVHITSPTGLIGNVAQANYAAAKLGIVAMSKAIALDMGRYNVRSNCVAPSGWTRMLSSVPIKTPQQQARMDKLRHMTPDKNAPMVVFLASDAAKEVNGQVFAPLHNEIFLFSSPRPIRSIHRSEGWTPESIAEHALPALKSSFMPVDTLRDVFSWDPV